MISDTEIISFHGRLALALREEELIGQPIKDHYGSIRSIQSLSGFHGFLTTSNDGSVNVRSLDGSIIESLMHPLQDDGNPPFILDW